MTRVISLPRGDRRLHLSWALPDFRNEQYNRFAWYLGGDSASYGTPSRENSIDFLSLAPGTHNLHIAAWGGLGQMTELEHPITIVVPDYWWDTTFVRLSAVLLAFGAASLLWRRRYLSSKAAEAKIAIEKKQVEAELHIAEEVLETLSGLIPICANCKKVRDDKGYWEQVEGYIAKRSAARFTHSYCPDCVKELYPELYDKVFPGAEESQRENRIPVRRGIDS